MDVCIPPKAESDFEHKLTDDKLAELVHDVESELYRLYNRDVGPKYKNKYRSLVFNLKDEKNLGLFRKVVTRRIGPRALVAMTAEQLASRELKEWRQAEQKGEIEKIRAHELDLAKQGNKFVIKTHKGDQIVDVDDQGGNSIAYKYFGQFLCHFLDPFYASYPFQFDSWTISWAFDRFLNPIELSTRPRRSLRGRRSSCRKRCRIRKRRRSQSHQSTTITGGGTRIAEIGTAVETIVTAGARSAVLRSVTGTGQRRAKTAPGAARTTRAAAAPLKANITLRRRRPHRGTRIAIDIIIITGVRLVNSTSLRREKKSRGRRERSGRGREGSRRRRQRPRGGRRRPRGRRRPGRRRSPKRQTKSSSSSRQECVCKLAKLLKFWAIDELIN